MLINLSIPKFALVVVLSKHTRDASKLIEKLDGFAALELSANDPAQMKSSVFAALNRGYSAALHLQHSHAKGQQNLERWAKSAGATLIVVRIGNKAPPVELPLHTQHHYEIERSDLEKILVERTPLPVDKSHITGPFDIIGDIHGCADELLELLLALGHARIGPTGGAELIAHPEARRVCLVGDLTDRGPKNRDALEIAYRLYTEFGALVVLGNHDFKLLRWLRGSPVRQAAGLQLTTAELGKISEQERQLYKNWLAELQPHYVLDHGRLIVAHAGLAERFHGSMSNIATSFALYGQKSGEVDTDGIDMTLDWAASYSGAPRVVHGHVVTLEPRRLNNVISVDTGCVFGGALTAYRYPENNFVSVAARAAYYPFKARIPASPKAMN